MHEMLHSYQSTEAKNDRYGAGGCIIFILYYIYYLYNILFLFCIFVLRYSPQIQ